MAAPQIWPAKSTNRGTSSVSANPKQCRASKGVGMVSHAGKSGILGISMAKGKIEKFETIREEEVLKAK